jgi:hypothetical protein
MRVSAVDTYAIPSLILPIHSRFIYNAIEIANE